MKYYWACRDCGLIYSPKKTRCPNCGTKDGIRLWIDKSISSKTWGEEATQK